jgi:two-component system phosphate regulon sensor histidine kinase PhoR
MPHRTLRWHLFSTYGALSLVPVAAVAWYGFLMFEKSYIEQIVEDGRSRAYLVGELIAGESINPPQPSIDSLCKKLSRETGTRISIIAPNGKLIGDSEIDPATAENHATRPEVIDALAGRIGVARRMSASLKDEMMYVAVPVCRNARIMGVARTSVHIAHVKDHLRRFATYVFLCALAVFLMSIAVSLFLVRRMSGPIETMRSQAQQFAEGDFSRRVPRAPLRELDELALALNRMADQLDERIQIITRQANEREAILSSMSAGIIAVDRDENILSINRAAEAMAQCPPGGCIGKKVYAVFRHSELQRFISRALTSQSAIEEDMAISDPRDDAEISLQVRGTTLRDCANATIGALIALNDVTRLRHLENVRKDFVANVSHELRTPLTSIKGFIETLQSGAFEEPANAKRFLGIVAAQVDRLDTIVEDLLTLSSIEKGTDSHAIECANGEIADVVAAAINDCTNLAQSRRIRIDYSPVSGHIARINPSLLQQAVINLLENAIKYSYEGGIVTVGVTTTPADSCITVGDRGIGIEPQHISRLFERFYRVDKARSRKLGGTGLGLAIVKHIVTAHGGSVSVESSPGKGSTFTIHLPREDVKKDTVTR